MTYSQQDEVNDRHLLDIMHKNSIKINFLSIGEKQSYLETLLPDPIILVLWAWPLRVEKEFNQNCFLRKNL